MKTRTLRPLTQSQEKGGWSTEVDPSAVALLNDPEGEDLLCGHCGEVIFEKVARNSGLIYLEGLLCPHCSGHNLLEA